MKVGGIFGLFWILDPTPSDSWKSNNNKTSTLAPGEQEEFTASCLR